MKLTKTKTNILALLLLPTFLVSALVSVSDSCDNYQKQEKMLLNNDYAVSKSINKIKKQRLSSASTTTSSYSSKKNVETSTSTSSNDKETKSLIRDHDLLNGRRKYSLLDQKRRKNPIFRNGESDLTSDSEYISNNIPVFNVNTPLIPRYEFDLLQNGRVKYNSNLYLKYQKGVSNRFIFKIKGDITGHYIYNYTSPFQFSLSYYDNENNKVVTDNFTSTKFVDDEHTPSLTLDYFYNNINEFLITDSEDYLSRKNHLSYESKLRFDNSSGYSFIEFKVNTKENGDTLFKNFDIQFFHHNYECDLEMITFYQMEDNIDILSPSFTLEECERVDINEITKLESDHLSFTFEYLEAPALVGILNSFVSYDKDNDRLYEIKCENPDNYSATSDIGHYQLILSSDYSDINGMIIENNLVIDIDIIDTKPPVVIKTREINVAYYDPNMDYEIRRAFSVRDNFCCSQPVFVYDADHLVLGKNEVYIEVVDFSDNYTYVKDFFYIYDDLPPEINGYENVVGPSIPIGNLIPYLNYGFLSRDDFEGWRGMTYSLSEDVKELNSSESKDVNSSEVDTSTSESEYVTYVGSSKDSSNNESNITFKYYTDVNMKTPMFISEKKIAFFQGTEMDVSDLIRLYQDLGYISQSDVLSNFKILKGNALDGKNEVGFSYLQVSYEDQFNKEHIKEFDVEVYKKVVDETSNKDKNSNQKYSKNPFVKFFQIMFRNIANFFIQVFRIK